MNLKIFAKRYHIVISTSVFVILIFISAFFFIEKSKTEESKRFGSTLFRAFVLNQSSKGDDLLSRLPSDIDVRENFIADFSKASILLDNKDYKSSQLIYEKISKNKNADKFFSLYALYMLAIDDFRNENGEQLIEKINQLIKSKFFKYHALELKGIYMFKNGEKQCAKTIFEEIISDGREKNIVPEGLLQRVDEIYSYLNN